MQHSGFTAKSSPNPGVRTPPARLARKRVLVVDDDQDSREALGVLLGQAGMNVALAASVRGEERRGRPTRRGLASSAGRSLYAPRRL